MLRDAASISSTVPILNESRARLPKIYEPEPDHGWCYYFEKADLARQFEDWHEVVQWGDAALMLDDYPNDPVERFVFIEGYAHVGQWDRALDLSNASYKVSRDYVGPLLCRLWRRIGTETVDDPDKSEALSQVKSMFACSGE
jgi:hypothetical protein